MELCPSACCYQQRKSKNSEQDSTTAQETDEQPCRTVCSGYPSTVLLVRRLPHRRLYVRMRPAEGLVSIPGRRHQHNIALVLAARCRLLEVARSMARAPSLNAARDGDGTQPRTPASQSTKAIGTPRRLTHLLLTTFCPPV
jgi:hypothetical protein